MPANRLRMKTKTKLLWMGLQYGFAVLGSSRPSLQLGADITALSDHVCLLGVPISSDLSLSTAL